MTDARYRTLLRKLFGAAMHSNLTYTDLKALSQELRRGRLSDELAFMIDRSLEHFIVDDRQGLNDQRVAEAERLIKRGKISKVALASILSSLGAPPSTTKISSREMLTRFFIEEPSSLGDKLLVLLAGQGESDSFLAGIDQKRK